MYLVVLSACLLYVEIYIYNASFSLPKGRSICFYLYFFVADSSSIRWVLASSPQGRPVRLMRALTEEECSKANDARRQQQMTKGERHVLSLCSLSLMGRSRHVDNKVNKGGRENRSSSILLFLSPSLSSLSLCSPFVVPLFVPLQVEVGRAFPRPCEEF